MNRSRRFDAALVAAYALASGLVAWWLHPGVGAGVALVALAVAVADA